MYAVDFCLFLLTDLPLIRAHSGLGFLCLVKTCTILSVIQGENGTTRRLKHHYSVVLQWELGMIFEEHGIL